MIRLNPLNDFCFLSSFGSKGCEFQLSRLLNACLAPQPPIKSLSIIENTTLPPITPGGKKSILDVRARLADGTWVNIEVQLVNKYNIEQRSLYYWARQYSRSLQAGQDYRVLPKVIVLGILGYRQSGGRPYHTTYRLREDGNPDRILTDNLEIHFLDLVRFREEAEKDVAGNAEHRWLSYLDVETPGETVEELVAMDIGIAKAQERMEEIARGGGLQRAYELYEMSLSDETSMLNGAREEGEAIGLTKGREETVKNLLAYGMSMEQISRALKLPPDTVRQYLN